VAAPSRRRSRHSANRRNADFELLTEERREFGYAVIDSIVDHLDELPDLPVSRRPVLSDTDRNALDVPFPLHPTRWQDVLADIRELIFANIVHQDHPRYFATVPAAGSFAGIMAEALSAGFQVFGGNHLEGAGPSLVERNTLRWLAECCGLPAGAGGIFLSGGSMANVHAVAAARQAKLPDGMDRAVAYCSDQTHSSVDRAVRLLGFAPAQLRRLPSDADCRLDPRVLSEAVTRDAGDGLRPFLVIANAGSTNTGAIDPLADLAEVCRRLDLWFHVDGAYGAAVSLSARLRPLLAGLGHADSIILDPHKWLFQPFGIGCLLVREPGILRAAFRLVPEYLEDYDATNDTELNFYDYGIELTRPFRALKLWLTLRLYGSLELARAIEYGCRLAEYAEARIVAGGVFEPVTPASIGILTFRCRSEEPQPQLHELVVQRLRNDGVAMLTSTKLRSDSVLRLCTINPRSRRHDIDVAVAAMEEVVRAYRR